MLSQRLRMDRRAAAKQISPGFDRPMLLLHRHRVAFDERYVWNRNANGSDAPSGRVAGRHFTQG
jgi:hypothetical protein